LKHEKAGLTGIVRSVFPSHKSGKRRVLPIDNLVAKQTSEEIKTMIQNSCDNCSGLTQINQLIETVRSFLKMEQTIG